MRFRLCGSVLCSLHFDVMQAENRHTDNFFSKLKLNEGKKVITSSLSQSTECNTEMLD